MLQKKSILVILLIVPFLLFMSNAEESHPSQTKDFIGKVINFLVLFGGLTYILRKPLGQFLQGRADSLGNALGGAKESREEAAGKLTEIKSRLKRLDDEIERLRQEADAEGRTLKQRFVIEAKQDIERLKNFTRQEIEMLTRDAIREIKEYAAALATDLAQLRIKDLMTDEFQSSLIDKSIERLEKLHENSHSGTKVRSRTH